VREPAHDDHRLIALDAGDRLLRHHRWGEQARLQAAGVAPEPAAHIPRGGFENLVDQLRIDIARAQHIDLDPGGGRLGADRLREPTTAHFVLV